MHIYTIDTGFFKLDGGAMFGIVPKTLWSKLNPPDEHNLCTWAMRCLMIEYEGKLILVDCGLGNKQDRKFFSHFQPHGKANLVKSIRKHGYEPSDITDVVLSHLHFDHCGGAIKRDGDLLVPQFSNAQYWSNEQHWNWATSPNPREKASFLKENILPIEESGQLAFLSENQSPFKALEFWFVNGHTEAQMLPIIQTGKQTFVYCADLIPSSCHIHMPYIMAYDVRPLDTLNEKRQLLKNAAENNWILIFEHDPHIECASIKEENGRYKIDETFKLEEVFLST